MRTLALLALLSLAVPAWADGQVTLATEPLVVKSDLWGLYGIALTKGGREVGPGFLALDLDDAVSGSPLAVEHAETAQAWAIANLGLAIVGAGLLGASVATYADRYGTLDGWPDLVPVRGGATASTVTMLASLVSLAGAIIARYAVYEEIVLSVNAYDRDVAGAR